MKLNLKHVPFSRYGSYFSIGYPRYGEELCIRTIRGSASTSNIFHIELTYDGDVIPYEIEATPTILKLKSTNGFVEFCIAETNLIYVRGQGVGVRLSMKPGNYDNAIPYDETNWMVNCVSQGIKLMLIPLIGNLKVDAPWEVDASEHIIVDFIPSKETDGLEFLIDEFLVSYKNRENIKTFDEYRQEVEYEYRTWIEDTVTVDDKYSKSGELAGYINWSCVVEPSGHIKRPAVYMSKNWMASIWSWDNCFNAMALAKGRPELAWDQLMIFDDHQDDTGMYPDLINDASILWSFCKPPIQGWVFNWFEKRGYFTDKRYIEEIYPGIAKWTKWWFKYSDADSDGIPHYNHGNDSGWDNSTIFSKGAPVESPDLSAFLIIQMEALANMARQLGKMDEARDWEVKSQTTLQNMLEHFWKGDRFVARISGSHECIDTQSLQLFIPIVLGNRLPRKIITTLVEGLKEEGRFLTPHGFATESTKSPYYTPNGYWRGPIWPPTSLILIDSLYELGEREFAKDMANRYCDMAQRSGMSENYDALTGEGLCDRAHTWGASVFLILADEYCR